MFSAYKHRTTLKALVCISPCGSLTFVSDLFGGSISDLELVQRSGILDLFEPGDKILVDRGVNILEECTKRQLKMAMPAFLNGRTMFTAHETAEARQVRHSTPA